MLVLDPKSQEVGDVMPFRYGITSSEDVHDAAQVVTLTRFSPPHS